MTEVLWCCWLGSRKGIRPVKNWVVGPWDVDVVMCLGQGSDLHMAQLMPLSLTISCSSKSRLVLPFWCRLNWVVPDKKSKRAIKWLCEVLFSNNLKKNINHSYPSGLWWCTLENRKVSCPVNTSAPLIFKYILQRRTYPSLHYLQQKLVW